MLLNPRNPDFLALAAAVKGFEGWADHFYLDTKGLVTIGIGHYVAQASSAPLLGTFSLAATPAMGAKDSEILNDYAVVKAATVGFIASYYADKCITRLSANSINRLFSIDLQNFQNELSIELPDYDSWPVGPQSGILDMALNMGIPRLKKSFPAFMGHAHNGNFGGMLKECGRTEDSDNAKRRNQWTEEQFRSAL